MSTKEEIVAKTAWPTSEEAATADALIVHGARLVIRGQVESDRLYAEYAKLDREAPGFGDAARAWMGSLAAMVAKAQVMIALAEVQKVSQLQADDLARHLWLLTEDGGALHELPWEYLEARGVDPEAVRAMTEEVSAS